MGGSLSVKERALLNAKHRIEYKYARYYMDEEPETEEALREEVQRIIEEEMDQGERDLLEKDIKREAQMISQHFDEIDLSDFD